MIDLLFEVGYYFDKIKEAALDNVADNIESICNEGKDPFEKYYDHKECHTMMLDAMRYESMPVARRLLALTSSVLTLVICD